MGATGTGKTAFVNLVSGSDLRVGTGLQSCTAEIQMSRPFELDGHRVTLIDTPGFDDTETSDFDILKLISENLAELYREGKKLTGVIYIHRISDFRFGGVARKNFTMFRQLCGKTVLKNVVIVTNMWGDVDEEEGEARENELRNDPEFFKPAMDNHAAMLRHDGSPESATVIVQKMLKNRPKPLRIQRELVDEQKDLSHTSAGKELTRELEKQRRLHEKEKEELHNLMESECIFHIPIFRRA
ncbi:P-loop containing nucleoside triphosphate hydrolase protein [Flagelloscypha sp. PMI_526]|nr:P-loop containing nucleoside triphosphate hydrolase protein [Flagelloscypha sp. PMI_526]